MCVNLVIYTVKIDPIWLKQNWGLFGIDLTSLIKAESCMWSSRNSGKHEFQGFCSCIRKPRILSSHVLHHRQGQMEIWMFMKNNWLQTWKNRKRKIPCVVLLLITSQEAFLAKTVNINMQLNANTLWCSYYQRTEGWRIRFSVNLETLSRFGLIFPSSAPRSLLQSNHKSFVLNKSHPSEYFQACRDRKPLWCHFED